MIENDKAYMDGIWNWNILDGCFGNTPIAPTDIDGCVERKGHKLLLETKKPGVAVKQGQEITFNSFVDDGNAVIIIWGEKDKPERIKVMTPFGETEKDADLQGLRAEVSRWFAHADEEPLRCVSAQRLAKVLHKRKGADYCDQLVAELSRLDEPNKR